MEFLNEKDHRFAVFQRVLDTQMKELLSEEQGTKVCQANPFLPEDEDKLGLRKSLVCILRKRRNTLFSL
jgi:hypothetical protein